MKKLLRYNALYFLFIISQLVVVVLGVQDDKIIGNDYKYDTGIFYHCVGLIMFTIGYIPISKLTFQNYNLPQKNIIIKPIYYKISRVLIIIGIITSVLTIGLIISPTEYLSILFSGNSELLNIRFEAGAGGLSGIFKMLNYLPLSVFLISNALMAFYQINGKDQVKMKRLILYALIGCLIKVFFSLDRLTLLALIIVFAYQNLLLKKIKKVYFLYLGIIISVLSFITASRMEGSTILDFLITYFKLSLLNYDMVIKHQDLFSYGFNTFLSPLWYVLKVFDIKFDITEPAEWVWNPAQYFGSYLFIDFGYYSFLLFLILGAIIRVIQINSSKGNISYAILYFITLFALSTFFTVPIIRGVEFWLMISIALFMKKFIKVY